MNEMPNSKPCRKDLLMQIGHASFAVDDVKLYLDTHPRDQEALDFFYEYNKKRNQLLKEYAKYYGPLTLDTANTPMDCWKWINEPAQTGGTGFRNHGHGRKEGVSLCGIMKNVYNIP